MNSQESKPSTRIIKRHDSHSHNNQEKESFKQENHSNTSFEMESEAKEKQAFITETRDSPFGIGNSTFHISLIPNYYRKEKY